MKSFLILLITILVTPHLFSQSLNAEKIDFELSTSYEKILHYRLGTEPIFFDSIEIENQNFRKKIKQNICNNPNSILYSFDSLKQNIHIVSSDDKSFRIYSWNTWLGGTMEDYESLFQFKSKDSIFIRSNYSTTSINEGSYSGFYSQIFTLKLNSKTYYLAIQNGKYSSKDISQSVKVISIENSTIIDSIQLFKTAEGFKNSIDIYFDFFSVVDRHERPLRLIKYDENKKILYIPIINEDEKVTNRFNLYQFTGKYFELIGTKSKRWLLK